MTNKDYSERLIVLTDRLAEHEDPEVAELAHLVALLIREYGNLLAFQRDAERAYRRIAFALDPASPLLQR